MDQKIILGTVQFGLNYGINNHKGKPDETEIKKILDFAFCKGVGILDSAEVYGDAHEIIGHYHRNSSNKFKVITKYSGNRADLPQNITERVIFDIEMLHVDSLYCYMFHSYKDFKKYYPTFINELLTLKKSKKIINIGVSLHSNDEIRDVLNYSEINVIQLPFNLLDNNSQREDILLLAKMKNVEVHTRSAFLQGLFFKDLESLPGNLVLLRDDLSRLYDVVPREEITKNALAYVNSKKYIDKIVIGIDNLEQLRTNFEQLNFNIAYDKIRKIDKIGITQKEMLNPSNWKI